MTTNAGLQRPASSLRQRGERFARNAATSRPIELLMRLGYVVRGLIYGVIGVLALQVALGGNETLSDPQGAIVDMGKTPFGNIVLYAICIGLIGYALWGAIQAIFDPLHKGTDLKGLASRAGHAISAGSYTLLALATYGLITGGASAARNGAQTAKSQQATASILTYSWGQWVVGIVALIVMAVGIVYIVRGAGSEFDQQFQPYALSSTQRTWMKRLGRFGTAARGVVFTLIGLFLLLAAYHHDPSQAQGIDGVLAALLHQSYGPWLLGIVALGLIAFGCYSALCGFWLRFKR